MSDPATAHAAEERARRAATFQQTGAEYHRLRPRYPEAAVDWMLPGHPLRVLDLGAGTGILTDALVARGLDVVAVDPSESMLAELRTRHPQIEVVTGTAEATGLSGESVEAVVIGQAWHWMDPQAASAEIARVLRPGGTLAMVWNSEQEDADWWAELEVVQPTPRGRALAGEREPSAPFGPLEVETFDWARETTILDLIELRTTHSAWLLASPEEQAERLGHWQELARQVPGPVTLHYRTEAWRTQRP